MKQSVQMKKLEEVLRSSKLVAGGFMGRDSRIVTEIIDADTAELSRLGYDVEKVAGKMQKITNIAKQALGNWTEIDEKRRAKVDEAKGLIPCPWPHSARFAKRVTTVKMVDSDQTIKWSDLNIHLIAEHGFFEGKGCEFRIEPKELIKLIF